MSNSDFQPFAPTRPTLLSRIDRAEIARIYHAPLIDLIGRAAGVHRAHHDPTEVQVCVLLSIKTGGCPEDCSYCSQSARYKTPVENQSLLDLCDVLTAAREAKASGATRFCMGAAWREVRSGPQFDRVLEMIRGVNDEGLEVCCTLGMVTPEQARAMKEAGLYAYNHNLDTSADHYSDVIRTRTYEDRLKTIEAVRDAGISVCCGGILGLGETDDDRLLARQLGNGLYRIRRRDYQRMMPPYMEYWQKAA